MPNNWTETSVGNVFDLIPGFAFKSGDFQSSGAPVIKIKNVKANRVVLNNLAYVDPSFLATKRRYIVQPEDLLITMSGNRHDGTPETWVGKIAQFRDKKQFLVNQRVGILRPKPHVEVDRRYCAYVLSSWSYQELFIAIATSSGGQANLSPSQIFAADLVLPPLPTQQRIADILGALDDKIELNQRINETLEAIARRLFRSWFIDFDPVHAKAALRRDHPKLSNAELSRRALPNMAPEIAELFPDSFVNSTLELIPSGWNAGTVPDAVEINPTRILSKGTVAPWLEMSNMPTRSARAIAWEHREFGSGTKFVNGDTLVARITPCLENGKTAFVDFLDDGQVGAGSTEYIILRPKAPLPPVFAYLLARTDDFRQHLITNMTGTSGRQRAPVDCLNTFPLVTPSKEIVNRFGEATENLFAQMKTIDEESMALAATRDRLLPRLLSGELGVADNGGSHEPT